MNIEDFESVDGLVKNLEQKFPNKLPEGLIGEVGLARLRGNQDVIEYIKKMLIVLQCKHTNNEV